MQRRGFGIVSIDIIMGPHCDLRDHAVFGELKGWILGGLVWGVFAGTPYESFSRARRAPRGSDMPGPLRSTMEPHGLPDLSEADRQRVALANLLADCTRVLLRAGLERGLVGGEENPAFSFLGDTP